MEAEAESATWLAEFAETLQARGDHEVADHFLTRPARGLSDIGRHVDAANTWYKIGCMRKDRRKKNWASAEVAGRAALAAWEASGAVDDILKGDILNLLGQARRAQGDLDQAIDFLQQSLTAFRRDGTPGQISWIAYLLGQTHQLADQPGAALPLLRESLDLFRQARPNESATRRLRLRQLRLGVSLLAVGDEAPARDMLRAALARGVTDGAPAEPPARSVDALVTILRASNFRIDNNPVVAEAIPALQAELDTPPFGVGAPDVPGADVESNSDATDSAAANSDDRQASETAVEFLTGLLAPTTQPADELAAAAETGVLDQAARELDSGVLRGQPETEYRLRFQLGERYARANQHEPARVQFGAAVTAARRAFGTDDARTARALKLLGVSQRRLGLGTEEEASLREAIAIEDRINAGGAGASWLGELGNTLYGRGKYEEAEHSYSRSTKLYTDFYGTAHLRVSIAWLKVARAQMALRRWPDAEASARKAIASRQASGAAPDTNGGLALEILAQARLAQGDLDEARDCFQQSLDMRRAVAKYPNQISTAALQLGETLQRLSRPADALELLRESLALQKRPQPGDEPTRRRQLRLGVSLLAVGDEAAAREMFLAVLSHASTSGSAGGVGKPDANARTGGLVAILRASEFRIDANPEITESFADLLPLINPWPIDEGRAGAAEAADARSAEGVEADGNGASASDAVERTQP